MSRMQLECQKEQGMAKGSSTDQKPPNATSDFDLCVFKSDLHNVPSNSLKVVLEGCSQYNWLNPRQPCSVFRGALQPTLWADWMVNV